MKKRVMVAMSGGVDSSVAALLLKEQGYDVVGVTMCFSLPAGKGNRPSCCGLEGIEDARKVAHQLDIPHYVLNFGKQLEKAIISDFVSEYSSARTPNPCVRCNQFLKFAQLLKKAKSLGIPLLATGHFARIEKKGRLVFLKKGLDTKKDQSYFLCQVKLADLRHVVFPLGNMTKDEVRLLAREKGLYVAEKPASQEVCFIPDNNYREFLKNRLSKACFKDGDIVDKTGKILGRHQGLFNFTIGQREGLRIAAAFPLYVIALDETNNRVVVGCKDDVSRCRLIAVELNSLVSKFFEKTTTANAKIRYNHQDSEAVVKPLSRNRIEVCFKEPQSAITPGQFIVFYKGDVVLGSAKITEVL